MTEKRSKAKRGKGHIAEKNGNYYLVISRGKIGDKYPPKWVPLKAKTYEDAELERDDIYTDRRRNVWIEPTRVTFQDYTKQFLKDKERAVKRKRLAENTYDWYESRIRNRINPVIGGLKLTEIKARDLQDLYDDIYEDSPTMADSIYRILHVIWVSIIKDKDLDIKYNLAETIEKGDTEKYVAPTWSGKQITYFLQNAKADLDIRFYGIFLLGFAAGMRLSEILGLELDSIDHKNMIIDVRKAIRLNKAFNPDNVFREKTKTVNSIRKIRMIPVVSETLKAIRQQQITEELAAKKYYKLNLVFTMKDGRPINYSNIRENYWYKLTEKLNSEKHPLPPMKIHSMRHSCASWLYNEMHIPIEMISDILGHSTTQITELLYIHENVQAQDPAMKLINKKFKEAGL